MLSYLLRSSVPVVACTFGSLFFLLSFLRRPESVDSLLGGFSIGLSVCAGLGVTEKLGARGPLGLGWTVRLSSALVKFGLI